MNIRTGYRIIFIILLLLCCMSAAGQPDAARVKTEVNKLVRELNMVPKDPPDNFLIRLVDKIIRGIISIMEKMGPLLIVVFIVALVFIAGFIGSRLVPLFLKERIKSAQTPGADGKTGGGIAGETVYRYLQEAEELAGNNKYGEALVLLHKGSIVFLQGKKILTAAEYHTNNEIRRELRHNKENYDTYYEPFSTIAGVAELRTFRAEIISPEIYNESLTVYKKNFIC